MFQLIRGFCADARWVKAVTLAAVFVSASAFADAPPTVAVPASANPAVVTAKTTVLSVLGADDGGAANLVYTWSTVNTPPAVPAYTRNGSNAAKLTTVRFNASGSYKFQVVISDKAGQTATSEVTVAVSATPTSIALSPTSLRMNPGTSRTFTALVRDQFVKNLAPQPAVAFAISGGGTVSSDGVFTAAVPGGPYTLTASSCGRQATASITVNAAPAFNTPAAVSANPVTTKNVVATVLGADDAGETRPPSPILGRPPEPRVSRSFRMPRNWPRRPKQPSRNPAITF
jgi:hypothetical protein